MQEHDLKKRVRKFIASVLKRYHKTFTGGFSVGRSYGLYFLFDWNHSIDKKVALRLYEDRQLRFAAALAGRFAPDCFFDIGAHSGLYSLLVRKSDPGIKVHAFEPDRQNLSQLYANLYLNKYYDAVQVYNLAVSSATGTAFLDRSDSTSRGTRAISGSGSYQIEAVRFDDLFHDTGSTAFFKIDVEGHECDVVDGARRFLQNNRCILLIESAVPALHSLQASLQELGYRESVKPTGVNDHVFTNFDASFDLAGLC